MPNTPHQGPGLTAMSCPWGRRQEMAPGDGPLPESTCRHRHSSLHSHAMLLFFSSSMAPHRVCRPLSKLPWHRGCCKHTGCNAAAGETQETKRGNLRFSTQNLTGWQQPWNLYRCYFLVWFAGQHTVDLPCSVLLSLQHNRALTGATTLCVGTRVFCAYMLLKESSALTGRAFGSYFRHFLGALCWRAGFLVCSFAHGHLKLSKSQLCCLVFAHRNCDLSLV